MEVDSLPQIGVIVMEDYITWVRGFRLWRLPVTLVVAIGALEVVIMLLMLFPEEVLENFLGKPCWR